MNRIFPSSHGSLRITLWIIAGLLLLPARSGAHGEIAGAGQQNLQQIVQAKGGRYRVELMHSPALPTAGEPANMELKVMRLLPEPDPLLGSEIPVGIVPSGSVLYRDSRKVLDPSLHIHPEGGAGVFGIAEYEFRDSGSFLLRFQIETETGDELTVDFPVSVATNVTAFFRLWVNLAVSALILGLTGMQLWKKRARGGQPAQMLRPIAVGAVCWVVVLLGVNFFILDQVLALREPKVVPGAAETVTANEDGTYTIPARVQEALGITLVRAQQVTLEQTFPAFGTVEAKPSHMAEVVAPLWGRIEFADQPLKVGDRVERGQELVNLILELTQLERFPMEAKNHDIQGGLRKAKERLEAAQLEYERAEKLFASNPAFEQDLRWAKELLEDANDAYEEIARQEKNYVGVMKWRDPRKTPVVSPIRGTITSVDFTPGQLDLFGEFRKLFTIVDTSVVWARGTVYLSDAGNLKIGQEALVYPRSNPQRPLRGKLHYIDDRVDPVNRTLSIILDIPNPRQQLLLGSFVRIEFPYRHPRAVAVPEQAVVDDGTTKRIYVAVEPERFLPLAVEMGIRQDGQWQVLSGLQEGDLVIGKGAALLGSLRQEQLREEGPTASISPLTPSVRSAFPAGP